MRGWIFCGAVLWGWVLWIGGCAQPQAPTGGERDTIPPGILYTIPEQGELNYKERDIWFVFDEWVGTKSLRKQLLLTPQPKEENPFRAQVRKNKLRLRFEQPLGTNRTYTLNLAGGIIDLTERNVVKELGLSFSTGPEIDSLEVKGEIYWAQTGKKENEALIFLVEENAEDTLHFTEQRPTYITRADEEGLFRFSYLSAGRYRLWALLDKNSNNRFELKDEPHAFVADTLHVLPEDSVARYWYLPMVEVDAREFLCLGSRPRGPYYEVDYNKDVYRYRIFLPKRADTLFLHSQITDKKRSVRFYKNSFFKDPKDSIEVYIKATDIQENEVLDTIFVRFDERAFKQEEKKGKKREEEETKRKRFALALQNPHGSAYHKLRLPLALHFSSPIIQYNLDSIQYIYQDSCQVFLADTLFRWNHNFTALDFSFEISDLITEATEEGSFALEIPADIFINIEGDSSNLLKENFSKADLEKYGTVSGKVSDINTDFFLELMNEGDKPQRIVKNEKEFLFKGLSAGKYYFRLTEDKNQDGRWNTSNILLNKPPEKIYIPDSAISVRENWILENINLRFPVTRYPQKKSIQRKKY